MTSYRIVLGIGMLHPGITPDAVLPAATAAARGTTTVESSDLAVVHGEARITVRFTADGNDDAIVVAQRVQRGVVGLAEVRAPGLARRSGPRWLPVSWRP